MPYIGEIRLVGFAGVPQGWLRCDGQSYPTQDRSLQALFLVIGNTYGGATGSFNVPNLVTRVPIHRNAARPLGSSGGEAFTLVGSVPAHGHTAYGTTSGADENSAFFTGLASATTPNFGDAAGPVVGWYESGENRPDPQGNGELPHENRQPYLGLHYVIAYQGTFPDPSQVPG